MPHARSAALRALAPMTALPPLPLLSSLSPHAYLLLLLLLLCALNALLWAANADILRAVYNNPASFSLEVRPEVVAATPRGPGSSSGPGRPAAAGRSKQL